MNAFRTALAVETRKARSSSSLRATGLLLAFGVPGIVAATIAAVRGAGTPEARAQLLAKMGPQIASADWNALVLAATQVTAAASVLAFGVGAAWIVGREFADGTAPALFGLPVRRSAIVSAKLVVHLSWAVLVTLTLVGVLTLAGLRLLLQALLLTGQPIETTFGLFHTHLRSLTGQLLLLAGEVVLTPRKLADLVECRCALGRLLPGLDTVLLLVVGLLPASTPDRTAPRGPRCRCARGRRPVLIAGARAAGGESPPRPSGAG